MHPFSARLAISWLHASFSSPVDLCLLLGELPPSAIHSMFRGNQEIARYLSPSVACPTGWCIVCLHWRVTHTRSSCGMLNLLTRNNTWASREPSTTPQIPEEWEETEKVTRTENCVLPQSSSPPPRLLICFPYFGICLPAAFDSSALIPAVLPLGWEDWTAKVCGNVQKYPCVITWSFPVGLWQWVRENEQLAMSVF